MFLEECKYVTKEKKMLKYITEDIEIFFDETDKEDCDEEISDEENSVEENHRPKKRNDQTHN